MSPPYDAKVWDRSISGGVSDPERSSFGPTRGKYTPRTVVLEATPDRNLRQASEGKRCYEGREATRGGHVLKSRPPDFLVA